MNAWNLLESMNNRMENRWHINRTDEYVSWVKGNVTKHVTNLLYTPRNGTFSSAKDNFTEHFAALFFTPRIESVTDTIEFMIEFANYPPAIAVPFQDCTLSAFDNLTHMIDVTELDPLDYLPSIQIGIPLCFEWEGLLELVTRSDEYHLDIFQFLMLWYWPKAVLLGPYWCELEELEPYFE